MSVEQISENVIETLHTSGHIAHHGSKAIVRDPQILLYPFLAGVFILLTLPTANGIAFGIWDKIAPHSVFTADQHIPYKIRILIGLVTFSYFYTTVVTTYFVCAVSATVLHKLDDQPTNLFHGLKEVGRHFLRVTHFAVLSIFFMPLAVIVQWRKLPRGFISVIGSALSLHTAQMAPAILHSHKSVSNTILDSIDTLGVLWKEGLIIKLATWTLAIFLTSLGFLPKIIEHYWFSSSTARWVGWLATTLLAISFWVLTKVLGAVFVSVLYHRAVNKTR
jgi:uncharacterized membrane protein YqaE (UPF0057 family)